LNQLKSLVRPPQEEQSNCFVYPRHATTSRKCRKKGQGTSRKTPMKASRPRGKGGRVDTPLGISRVLKFACVLGIKRTMQPFEAPTPLQLAVKRHRRHPAGLVSTPFESCTIYVHRSTEGFVDAGPSSDGAFASERVLPLALVDFGSRLGYSCVLTSGRSPRW